MYDFELRHRFVDNKPIYSNVLFVCFRLYVPVNNFSVIYCQQSSTLKIRTRPVFIELANIRHSFLSKMKNFS